MDDLGKQVQPESDLPLKWAVYYASLGCQVFPVFEVIPTQDGLRCACYKGSACPDAGKHPRTPCGFHDATVDEIRIRRWWRQWPRANIAIRTGDGHVVLDIDVVKGGDESLEKLERRYGRLPATRQAVSGSRGQHRWFRLPTDMRIGSSNGFEDGLDVRADDGYVVVEPSLHITGNSYRWDGIAGFEEPVALIPLWLLNILLTRPVRNRGELWRQINIIVSRRPCLPEALLEYLEEDITLSRLWNLRRSDLADPKTGRPDFSRYDLGLASHFVSAGIEPQAVADVLTAFRLKHGNPKGKGYRRDYLQRTIQKAIERQDDWEKRGHVR